MKQQRKTENLPNCITPNGSSPGKDLSSICWECGMVYEVKILPDLTWLKVVLKPVQPKYSVNTSLHIQFGWHPNKSHFNWPSYLQTTNIARNYLNIWVSYLSTLSIPSLNNQISVRLTELGRSDVLPSAQPSLIWINLDQRYHGSHQCICSAMCQWVLAAFLGFVVSLVA